jgi:hypothetical protein
MKGILPASCLAAFLGLASVPSIAAGEGAVEGGPELRLSVHGEFRQTEARVGDTVVYRVRVEWQDVPAAVMLLPLPQLETPGFVSVGGSTEHRKKLSGGKSMNVTEYAYALVAREPGVARVAPFSLNYRNGLTGRDESVGVPGASIEISAAPVPWARRPATWVLAALVLLTGAGWAVRTVARAWKKRRATGAMTPSPKESPLDAEIALLRARCESADARAWTADAEKLCTRFLCDRLGVTRTENVRFEAALDQYLQRGRDTSPEVIAGWNALRELFHEARYAGARREPHALLEACRHLKTCLNPSEGIEHGQPVSA